MEKQINVFGYIRVSTENQVKEGYSLMEQEEKIREYCEGKYNLLQMFRDEGKSGAKANEDELTIDRDGLIEMLARLKDEDIKYIVVLTTSRLWRSDMVKVLIQRELKKLEIDVIAIDRPNYSIYNITPNDFLINGMFELLDTYERLEIALKLKRGRIRKAKDGGYSGGGAPFGYMAVKNSKVLTVAQDEAEVVRAVFSIKEKFPWLTLREIAKTLNDIGITGRNGKNINQMLIKRIIDNEDFYRGTYKYSGVETAGRHEAIL